MLLNGFKVTIPQGTETNDGYVKMVHGVQYTINLGNRTDVDADAIVTVDGKPQGKFRVHRQGSITLERPIHDTGHFTCYKLDSPEGRDAQLNVGSDLGLITVEFKPARHIEKVYTPDPFLKTMEVEGPPLTYGGGMKGITRSAAGTGLSGTSSQKFHTVPDLDYDESQKTTIHLRLFVNDDTPRPLTSVSRETPIPAAV